MKQGNTGFDRIEKLYAQYDQGVVFLGKLIEYADDVDAILKDVANHYDADRSYVFEFSEDGKTLDNTYEWCKEGVTPQINVLQNLPSESVELWVAEFERVGAFFISALEKDVEVNSLTYEILEPQGIDSLITAPIYQEEKLMGFVGIDNPHANTDDIVILKLTASILYSEIRRKIATKNQAIMEMTEAQQKQDAELGKIRDIIASANMGMWRIELVENEEPRMYVDDTMKKLLGIDGKDASPEQTYDDWFYNITEDAVPSVLNSVERMEQGHFDENTYLWKHPSKGIRYVRCGGTAKSIPGGYSLQGYHYDVDEVVRKSQAQMLKLKKALEDKKEYYDTLGALGDVFYSMHIIDLKSDTVVEFNARNEVKELVDSRKSATPMMKYVMSSVTDEAYLTSALKFTDLTTLPERLKNRVVLSQELLGKNIGWFLASFIMMEQDEEGRPTKVIYLTRVIDEEMKQKETLIYKTQTDEMTGLNNRRAYEEKIYEHNDIPVEDKFIYVSIDVNGLKMVNDTIGHAAGDEMLIGVSQCMKNSLGQHGHLYRIGGDEFVAILFCDKAELKAILKDFDDMVDKWTGKLVDHISVSYGWIDKKDMPEASTRQLGAIAEQRMYESKSAHYRKQGVDRRGQQDAHRVLCELYTKILRINISDNSYQIINMDVSEQSKEKGFANKISEWLISFGTSGQVHPEDLEEYLRMTDLRYMKDYFQQGRTSLHIFYRRRIGNEFKQCMMEIVPTSDYTEDNMSLFLYVKNIDK